MKDSFTNISFELIQKKNDSINAYFDPKIHKYFIDHKPIMSGTEICKLILPNEYDKIPQSILEIAAERSKKIHSIISNYLITGTMKKNPFPEYSFEKEFKKEFPADPEGSQGYLTEFQLFSKEKNFGGTPDIFDVYKNWLIDIKVTDSLNLPYVTLQLALYSFLIKEYFGSFPKKHSVFWITKRKAQFVNIDPVYAMQLANEFFKIQKQKDKFETMYQKFIKHSISGLQKIK